MINESLRGESKSFYVSPDGNDETGDGTETNPWKSIQKAVDACSYIAEDRIWINSGIYYPTDTITISNKKIIFYLYENGQVTLYDHLFTKDSSMILVEDKSSLRITNYNSKYYNELSICSYVNCSLNEAPTPLGGNINSGITVNRDSSLDVAYCKDFNVNGCEKTNRGIYVAKNSSCAIQSSVSELSLYTVNGIEAVYGSNITCRSTKYEFASTEDASNVTNYAIFADASDVYVTNVSIYGEEDDALSVTYGLYVNRGGKIGYGSMTNNNANTPTHTLSGGRIYTGSEDFVNKLTNSISGRNVCLIKSGDNHYLRPDTSDGDIGCGSNSYPWMKVFTNALEIFQSRIQCQPSYDNTVTYATNLFVGSTGIFSRSTNTSSRTIKHDIKEIENKELNADKLYDVGVYQFKYNDGIITDENDARYQKDLVGFIIEDLNEKYPIAVDKPSEDVKEWSWNAQYLIPPMLKLIQEQKRHIDDLEKRVSELEQC